METWLPGLLAGQSLLIQKLQDAGEDMATQQTRTLGKLAVSPSVLMLLMWMIVPLSMTIYFSFLRYNLLDPNPICSLLTPGAFSMPRTAASPASATTHIF